MNEIDIGKRLKKARKNQNLTLDEMSRLTHVSKPMLGQIERNQSSPTVNTLWKIASGLKVPFSYFLQENSTDYTFIDIDENNMITEENGKMRAYTYFSFDPVHHFEIFYIEFDEGCLHDSTSHNEGIEEYVFIISGQLDMVINGTKVLLKEKQAIRFEANVPHSYLNPYNEKCCIYNIIFYK